MRNSALQHLPVAVIGGGPVGLAAAAHLIARGLPVKVYEAGPAVGSNVRNWGHVRVFTPWRYCVDAAATALLSASRVADAGLTIPCPTGAELVSVYLEPLAATPELTDVIEINVRITAISRQGIDKVVSHGRETRPFVLAVASREGVRRDLARAVIDASRHVDDAESDGGERLAGGGRGRRRAIGSPTAFRISSAATVMSMRVEGRSSWVRATPQPMRCSSLRNSRKSTRKRPSCGRREAPIWRDFIAVATLTSCRRAVNSAPA